MIKIRYFINAALLTMSVHVYAETEPEPIPNPIDVKYAACSKKVHEFPAMLSCVESARNEWDAELNGIYAKLEKKMINKDEDRQALANTHKAWLIHRDAEFALYSAIKDVQEADNYLFAVKKMKFVSNRAKELQEFDDYVW